MNSETICFGRTSYAVNPIPALTDWMADQMVSGHQGRRFIRVSSDGRHPIEYARNFVVGEFLKTDADRLWFLDSDMIPNRTTLGLLGIEGDIVCGMYRWFNLGPSGLEIRENLLNVKVRPSGYLFIEARLTEPGPVDAGGCGCMLIRRRVLEDPRMWTATDYLGPEGNPLRHLPEDCVGEWIPPVFQHNLRPSGQPIETEDVDFCLRARNLGYSVIGDPHHGMGHGKFVNVDHVHQLLERARTRGVPEVRP